MRAPTLIACCAAAALAAADVNAQEGFRTTDDRSGVWLNYAGEHAIGKHWAFLLDGSIRRGDFASVWRSFLVRPGMQWQVTPGVRFGGGYTFTYAYPGAAQSSTTHTPEHRIFQQVLLSHSAGNTSLTHRYRFEHRWTAQTDTAADDQRNEWVKRQRFRYQLRGTLPLGSGRTYLTGFDEVFVNLGANVRYNVFDQNRFAAGVGVRLTPALRLETYYLNYFVLHADGRGVDRTHVWMTVLNSTHARRRNARQ